MPVGEMQWAIGVMVAPRPVETVHETLYCLSTSWGLKDVTVFCEPGDYRFTGCRTVMRPETIAPKRYLESPEGRFGNFQNWLQTADDLMKQSPDADVYMIVEDDARITRHCRSVVEDHLWPSSDCGCVSLYSPNMGAWLHGRGLIRPNRVDIVGALALAFPGSVLRRMVEDPSIQKWGGSHAQVRAGHVEPWERKAVDTWVGRALHSMHRTFWSFVPSLVQHFCPVVGRSNSSMGHGAGVGCRRESVWAGLDCPPERMNQLYRPRAKVFIE